MKRIFRQMMFGMLAALACVLLSGCTVGDHHIFDAYVDEDGERHFMGFGEMGPRGGEETGEEENPAKQADDLQENETSGDPESITGTMLKKGWTSSDPSILKGKMYLLKRTASCSPSIWNKKNKW